MRSAKKMNLVLSVIFLCFLCLPCVSAENSLSQPQKIALESSIHVNISNKVQTPLFSYINISSVETGGYCYVNVTGRIVVHASLTTHTSSDIEKIQSGTIIPTPDTNKTTTKLQGSYIYTTKTLFFTSSKTAANMTYAVITIANQLSNSTIRTQLRITNVIVVSENITLSSKRDIIHNFDVEFSFTARIVEKIDENETQTIASFQICSVVIAAIMTSCILIKKMRTEIPL